MSMLALPDDILKLILWHCSLEACAILSYASREGKRHAKPKIDMAVRLRSCGFVLRDTVYVRHLSRDPRENFVFMAAVARGFYATLCHLSLHNHVDDAVLVCLTQVGPSMPKLTTLTLSCSFADMPTRRITHQGLCVLTSTHDALPSLEMLCMPHNALYDEHAVELAFFPQALPKLRRIDVSHNSVGNVGIEALTALAHVEELRLSWCCVTTLPHCAFLRSLDVCHCKVHSEGIERMAQRASTCTRLVELRASHNRYSRDACDAVVHAPFPALRFVDLDHHDRALHDACRSKGLYLL